MNCQKAFQIYLYFENCMTNRVSLKALKKGDILQKESGSFVIRLSRFFHCKNQPHKLLCGM